MGRTPTARDDDQFSDQEAQQRFMVALKAAVNTPPKPLKAMGRKGVPAQSKKSIQIRPQDGGQKSG
jgi:hypothetical protein